MRSITSFQTLCLVAALAATASHASSAPLRADPTNPRYFFDGNKTLYLAGSATWPIMRGEANVYAPSRARIDKWLGYIDSYGHNFTRIWSGYAYLTSNGGSVEIWPWRRSGGGSANDGKARFDLNNFDQEYFNLLRYYVTQANARGMKVSVMLFGSFNRFRGNLNQVTWHPQNNINSETDNFYAWQDFFRTSGPLFELQKRTIRKFVDELHDLDNFWWEIVNEPVYDEVVPWHEAITRYINDYERQKGYAEHRVQVSGSWGGPDSGPINKNGPWDVFSPEWADEGSNGHQAWYQDKIVVVDTDHIQGFSESSEVDSIRETLTKAFLRGNHSVFMDSWDSFTDGNGGTVMSTWNPHRRLLGDLVALSEQIDLRYAVPSSSSSKSNTGYYLAHPNNDYIAYQPGSGNLQMYVDAGNYTVRYLDVIDGSTSTDTKNYSSSGLKSLTPPPHIGSEYIAHVFNGNGDGGDGGGGNPGTGDGLAGTLTGTRPGYFYLRNSQYNTNIYATGASGDARIGNNTSDEAKWQLVDNNNDGKFGFINKRYGDNRICASASGNGANIDVRTGPQSKCRWAAVDGNFDGIYGIRNEAYSNRLGATSGGNAQTEVDMAPSSQWRLIPAN